MSELERELDIKFNNKSKGTRCGLDLDFPAYALTKVKGLLNSFVARKFLMAKNLSKKPSMRLLPEKEKLEFLKTSVSWIESKDIMDTCFVLNYGYEFPLPWPQVQVLVKCIKFLLLLLYKLSNIIFVIQGTDETG